MWIMTICIALWSLMTALCGLSSVRLVAIGCGQQHTVAVDDTGGCFSWGLGSFGQLGHGRKKDERSPRKVAALWRL